MSHPDLSLVFPVRNEADSLEALHQRAQTACRQAGVSYEMVFVDDGSEDASLDAIKTLRRRDPAVRFVSLSRSFGHQAALMAGLAQARGAAAITMDADLQHPPELIPQMVRLWQEGYEIVYTTKRETGLPLLWKWQMRAFYAVLSRLSGLRLGLGQSDFRLLDRRVIDVLRSLPEHHKFLRGLVSWVGFRQEGLEYALEPRSQGQSQYRYRERIKLGVDGVLSFSALPLRFVLAFGLVIVALTMPYFVWVVVLGVMRLSGGQVDLPPGWVSVVASVLWLGSVQLISIGVLGEYIVRIYDQAKGRPEFIVREASEVNEAQPVSTPS